MLGLKLIHVSKMDPFDIQIQTVEQSCLKGNQMTGDVGLHEDRRARQ